MSNQNEANNPEFSETQRIIRLAMDRRQFIAIGGAGIAAAILASCGSSSDDATSDTQASTEDTPVVPTAAEITLITNRGLETIDNKVTTYDAQITFLRLVRQSVVALGDSLEVVPVLASAFAASDETTWSCTLRGDVTFSDGSPVTSNDVKVALESYLATEGNSFAGQWPEIPTLNVIDDKQFNLVTTQRVVNLDRLMTNVTVVPASANQAGNVDDAPGSGPYVVESFDKGAQVLVLVPNPSNADTVPFSRITARYVGEDSARVNAIKAGEAHIVDSITPDMAVELASDSNITILRSPGTRLAHLFYNFRKPAGHPMSNPKVRQALSMAVDGQSIVSNILLDTVTPLTGVVPSTLFGTAVTGEFTYDPEMAKSMLSDAGVSNLKLTMIWEKGEFFSIAQVMEAIAAMLSEIGVATELKEFEPGGDLGEWRAGRLGDWDVLGNGYGNQTGDALTPLIGIYGGTAEKEAERKTYHGYVYPEITTLLVAASAEIDSAKQADLMNRAQKLIWETWPSMFAFTQNNILAHRNNVSGIVLRPNNTFDLLKVSVS
jgi:peptide/nickel transport system substrate-binding protein